MKTKIIYISGNEVFDMRDIRAAFEEVRCALNLDKNTVLFGVPVDNDDACLMNNETPTKESEIVAKEIIEPTEIIEENIPTQEEEIEETPIVEETVVTEETPKKRGRPRKEEVVVEEDTSTEEIQETSIPILSILSVNEEHTENESVVDTEIHEDVEVITDITDEKTEIVEPEQIEESIAEPAVETVEESEPDLEKLLSEMTPLQEDTIDEVTSDEPDIEESEPDLSVDATLEQLATEYVSSQDKIAAEPKSHSRSKIGKLRNILPFKQSKHKDQGIGDLLEWAGIAANDEDFSVPGFFTNAASRK